MYTTYYSVEHVMNVKRMPILTKTLLQAFLDTKMSIILLFTLNSGNKSDYVLHLSVIFT